MNISNFKKEYLRSTYVPSAQYNIAGNIITAPDFLDYKYQRVLDEPPTIGFHQKTGSTQLTTLLNKTPQVASSSPYWLITARGGIINWWALLDGVEFPVVDVNAISTNNQSSNSSLTGSPEVSSLTI